MVSNTDKTNEEMTDKDWKKKLTSTQYKMLREKATERAFTGPFLDNKEQGVYLCAGCGNKLFTSGSKYNSGSGWPSFFEPITDKSVGIEVDRSQGMIREEIVCSNCNGHLGHVFPDGPMPTGTRYCVNGNSMTFKKQE